YQLNLARASGGEPAAAVAPVARREREIVARLNARLDEAEALLVRAVGDPRNDVSDRITLARMQGTLGMLRREVAPFEAAGRRVLAARAEGDREAADAMLAEFTRFE